MNDRRGTTTPQFLTVDQPPAAAPPPLRRGICGLCGASAPVAAGKVGSHFQIRIRTGCGRYVSDQICDGAGDPPADSAEVT